MPSYAQNKQHIYKWRKTHYKTHCENQVKYQFKYNNWKKIQKIFLQILLN